MPTFLLRRANAVLVALAVLAPVAGAQGPAPMTISLDDALRMAAGVSHPVRAAEAGVLRARGQQAQARSQYFPQLSASAGYQRTIQSQFQEIQKREPASTSPGGSSSNSFGSIGKIFASPVTETITLNFSQSLFTGGRIEAATAGARAARAAADIGLDAARAQMALDVAQAYFDAVAASRLVEISDSTLAQTERSLQNTSLAYEVGTASEFDLLRARVAHDNQRPAVIQARGNRDVALLRLRQLLGIPLSQPIALSTPIRDEGVAPATPAAPAAPAAPAVSAPDVVLARPIPIPGTSRALTPDTAVERRAAVRIAEANVEAQQAAVRAASWQRLPSLQLASTYQRFGYPANGLAPNSFGLFYPNWTVTAGFSFPLFTGGRIGGDRMVAEANLDEARQALAQTREAAELDARTAVTLLEQAQAAYTASIGTDAQAARAYAIAEVRQREGISTEVELQQSRTQYEQARLNRVLAARDLEVAKLRVALLKDLPMAPRR